MCCGCWDEGGQFDSGQSDDLAPERWRAWSALLQGGVALMTPSISASAAIIAASEEPVKEKGEERKAEMKAVVLFD